MYGTVLHHITVLHCTQLTQNKSYFLPLNYVVVPQGIFDLGSQRAALQNSTPMYFPSLCSSISSHFVPKSGVTARLTDPSLLIGDDDVLRRLELCFTDLQLVKWNDEMRVSLLMLVLPQEHWLVLWCN